MIGRLRAVMAVAHACMICSFCYLHVHSGLASYGFSWARETEIEVSKHPTCEVCKAHDDSKPTASPDGDCVFGVVI